MRQCDNRINRKEGCMASLPLYEGCSGFFAVVALAAAAAAFLGGMMDS